MNTIWLPNNSRRVTADSPGKAHGVRYLLVGSGRWFVPAEERPRKWVGVSSEQIPPSDHAVKE